VGKEISANASLIRYAQTILLLEHHPLLVYIRQDNKFSNSRPLQLNSHKRSSESRKAMASPDLSIC
jgi:hypothetical protein